MQYVLSNMYNLHINTHIPRHTHPLAHTHTHTYIYTHKCTHIYTHHRRVYFNKTADNPKDYLVDHRYLCSKAHHSIVLL